jgi:hypothetical protein
MQSTEGVIEIRFGTETYRGNYLEDLAVAENSINPELMSQPARYVFWSKLSSLARILFDQAKMELDKYEAQAYTFKRQELTRDGGKVTEKQLESMTILDPRWQEKQQIVMRARLQYDHLIAIKEAFSMRSSMLVSLAANLRGEMESSLSIKDRSLNVVAEQLRSSASPKAQKYLDEVEK